MQLTRNQCARDPADRRDQALFRAGRHEHAIRGYAARDRVHITSEQTRAENHALDAAHADRTAGKTTIVIAQTSNERLDELNARAQAIRHQHNQLGPETLPVPGRPYAVRPGDEIQIRRTIPHPDHGQLRNGTTAQVATIDPETNSVALRLADGIQVGLDAEQAVRADLRLAYVQHPFPAQGQTTDTAHLIIGEHATQEGSYVALTRAREQTHIYAVTAADEPTDGDRLQALSERMSRTEPDLPSIHTPLAQESAIATELARVTVDLENDNSTAAQITPEHSATSPPKSLEPATQVRVIDEDHARESAGGRAGDPTQLEPNPESSPEREPTAARAAAEAVEEQNGRAWPRSQHRDPDTLELTNEQTEDGRRYGWEP